MALCRQGKSLRAISTQTGIARSTLRRWMEKGDAQSTTPLPHGLMGEETDGEEISATAQKAMSDALTLLWKQVKTALGAQKQLDALLQAIREDGDVVQKERLETAKRIAKMAWPDMREWMNAIGSLYDRQATGGGAVEINVDLSGLTTKEIRRLLAGDTPG